MTERRLVNSVMADLGTLELLLSVIELGSMSEAGRRYGISQPAVSSRVRQLERRLGVALLVRSPTGCRPTTDGAVVARSAAEVLREASALAETVSHIRASHQPGIRLSASLTIAEHLLPEWLGRLWATHSGLPVELHVENCDRVLELVRTARVDVGFVESPDAPPCLAAEVVGGDELWVICGSSHPWASRREELSPAELGTTPLVLREMGAGGRHTLEARLAQIGVALARPAAEVASPAALCAAVAAGLAPGVVSDLAVATAPQRDRLRRISVTGLDLRRDFRAVWQPPRRPSCIAWLLGTSIG